MYNNKVLEKEENKGISASVLKWIAIITMFIDHFAVNFIDPVFFYGGRVPESLIEKGYFLLGIMRGIGRIAFPIFVFLLVESFFLTSNRMKMCIRFFVFAIITEVFFDLSFYNSIFEFTHQNIYFTLLLGFIAMLICEKIGENTKITGYSKIVFKIIVFIAFMFIADFMKTDYGYLGIFAIGAFYFLRDGKRIKRVVATVVGFSFYLGSFMVIPAYLSSILMYFYNGKRGKQNKYFFYLFYPVHLIVIFLLRGMFLGFNLF
ncbi:conjugal transfer protein TraX [Peptostreptococcaceae bacterium OttesenSCG-928-C18]|nr:conjugal transfer protein TraX [Peptostreptococcaceae bacterium OttesenSCG-928-C18]